MNMEHPFRDAIDASAVPALGSSPWWWPLLDSYGHMILLAFLVIGGGLRIALMVKELRK